ncbi:MAG: hypothetical protein V3U72_00900, partial [Candidatus Aenigmarchaeota archaeon]
KWKDEGKGKNKSFLIINESVIFEKPVDLNWNNTFLYPFDTFETVIKFEPHIVQEKTSPLSFEEDKPYEGIAEFENDMVSFHINRKLWVTVTWLVYLIFSLFYSIYVYRHFKNLTKQSFQPRNILKKFGYFSILLGYFYFYHIVIISIGTFIYLAIILILVVTLYLRKRKLES